MVPIEDLTGMSLAIEDEDLSGDKSYLVKWLDALRGSSPARQINCTTPCNLCNTMQYHDK